jgi:hypothetical protein
MQAVGRNQISVQVLPPKAEFQVSGLVFSLVTRHSSLAIRHSSFVIPFTPLLTAIAGFPYSLPGLFANL